jgi:hypothetical protein
VSVSVGISIQQAFAGNKMKHKTNPHGEKTPKLNPFCQARGLASDEHLISITI